MTATLVPLQIDGGVLAGGSNASGVQVVASNASGQVRGFGINTSQVPRWLLAANSDAESGSNAGSTLQLTAYSDAGSAIDNPIAIVRASAGTITLGGSTNRSVQILGTTITAATAPGAAGLRLPHGTAPASPTNGDLWTTTAGLYVQISGATVGPLGTGGGGGSIGGSISSGQIAVGSGTNTIGGSTGLTSSGGGISATASITSAITGSSTTNFVANATTAGTSCGITLEDGGTAKWTLYKVTTNQFILYDNANNFAQLTCTAGASSAGVVAINLTTASSSASTGALTVAGGVGIGGVLNVAGTATIHGGALTTSATSGNATMTINAASGSTAFLGFQVASAYTGSILSTATNPFQFSDVANSQNPLNYTAGSASACVWAFSGTKAATSTTSAAVTISGGLGVAGATFIGGGLTVTGVGIISTITGNSTTNFIANASTAGTECGLTFQDGGSAKWTLYKETTNTFNVFDNVNSVAQISVTAGSGITGVVSIAGVLTTGGAATLGGASAPSAGSFAGNKIWGRNDGTAVVAGAIGQNVQANAASPTALTTSGSWQQVTSVTLSAGVYLIIGIVNVTSSGGSAVNGSAAISTTTASSSGSTLGESLNYFVMATTSSGSSNSGVSVMTSIAISTSTTYYLNINASWGAAAPQVTGCIKAIRIG